MQNDNYADGEKIWNEVLEELSVSITDFQQNMFVSKIEFLAYKDNTIWLSANSNFVKTSFLSQLAEKFIKALSKKLNKKIKLEIEVENESEKEQKTNAKPINQNVNKTSEYSKTEKKINSSRKENPKLNLEYTFENFVISENNSFAANAAKAISKNPGHSYNPFLIYGGVGLGKTHLMEAIGNEIIENSNLKVLYVPTEDFMNEFVKCLSENKMHDFKKKYRGVDILLLDDIQFFQKKEQLQNEFFYTFNHLYDTKKQMVFTCDRPPSTLQNLADRLKSRFEQGLNVDLKPPSFETRCAILRKKLEMQNREMENELIELIAKNISSNIRDLNASLTKLLAFEDLTNQKLNLEKAKSILKDSFTTKNQINVSLDKVLKVVADFFEISVSDIRSKKRPKKITTARHYAMFLAKEITGMSTTEIGNEVGNREHATVLHSCKKIEEGKLTKPGVNETLDKLRKNIREID